MSIEVCWSPKNSLQRERDAAKARKPNIGARVAAVLLLAPAVGLLVGALFFPPSSGNKSATPNSKVQHAANMPDSLLINGERWNSLAYSTLRAEDHADGLTDCDQRVIWIAPEILSNYALYREVMWHEVMHAMNCPRKTNDKWTHKECAASASHAGDHLTICVTAESLPSFINDNPDFMKWQQGH